MSSSTNTPSVSKLAIRGAIWTLIGYGTAQIIRFGSNLILTRLLAPELFGLMALVYVFITGLHLFSDVGIGISIVQNKRGDEPAFLNTAWTIQVMRGAVLWVACLLLAYPAAQFYQQPRFVWLIPVVGLSTIISGFNSTAIFSLNRHLAVKEIALFELSGQVVGTTVMIVWAWIYPTVWAMVGGGLVTCVFQLFLSYRLGKGKLNHFTWDKSAVREIASFGVWIFLTTALTFFGEQSDRLILGKVLSQDLGETQGLAMLGIYGIAMTFADLPRSVTSALNGKVVMPALSKVIDQPRATVRSKLRSKRRLILLAMAVGLAGLAAGGDFIIKTLYDSRYADAAWMLPVLALGIWPRLMCNTNEAALFAISRPQYTAGANLTRFICTAIGIWIGYSIYGLPGAVAGVALNDFFYYLVIIWGLRREGLSNIRQDLLATGILLSTLILLLGLRSALGLGLPIDSIF